MNSFLGGIFGGGEGAVLGGAGSQTRSIIIAVVIVALIIVIVMMLSGNGDKGGTGAGTSAFRAQRGQTARPAPPRAAKRREGMSVGAHWDQSGTYGHTPDTLSAPHAYSGYSQGVPSSW